jgi:MFS family permease
MHKEEINQLPPKRLREGCFYPWFVLGLLWFCGFFNYADRQAVNSVFPLLEREFGLSKTERGLLGSAFMIIYASTAPFAGYVVDRLSRRLLIPLGLAFWSLICAATGISRTFPQLLFFRAAEGLGESFYFPASMSFLADYHGPRTRSLALGIHQTSVYLGTAGGAVLAGILGEHYGWRSPFYLLGLAGMLYAVFLGFCLVEPVRGQSDTKETEKNRIDENAPGEGPADLGPTTEPIWSKIERILINRAALSLLCVFVGANFVAATFLTWLPNYIFDKFGLSLSGASTASTAWSLASLAGAVGGGLLADRAARRWKGGRILMQALGLIVGSPFVFLAGWSGTVPLLLVALIGAGLCKGIYDANIFASLFDVVRPEDRGTAAGLMNTLGWTGGFVAPTAVGIASERFGLSAAIASTAVVYLLVGLLALVAAGVVETRTSGAFQR